MLWTSIKTQELSILPILAPYSKDGMYHQFIHYIDFFFFYVCSYSYDSHSHLLTIEFFRAYAIAMQTGDKTGRLLKYDPRSKEVMVLLRGLSFSNGVALSQDNDFVLVTETTAAKVTRYWL